MPFNLCGGGALHGFGVCPIVVGIRSDLILEEFPIIKKKKNKGPRLGAYVIVLKVLDLAEHGRGFGRSRGWHGRNLGSFLNLV